MSKAVSNLRRGWLLNALSRLSLASSQVVTPEQFLEEADKDLCSHKAEKSNGRGGSQTMQPPAITGMPSAKAHVKTR
jgi:hypothetical protein